MDLVIDEELCAIETVSSRTQFLANKPPERPHNPEMRVVADERSSEDIYMELCNKRRYTTVYSDEDKTQFFHLFFSEFLNASAAARQLGIHVRAVARLRELDLAPIHVAGANPPLPSLVSRAVQEMKPFMYIKYTDDDFQLSRSLSFVAAANAIHARDFEWFSKFKPIRLAAIDFAGLSTEPNDIRVFIREAQDTMPQENVTSNPSPNPPHPKDTGGGEPLHSTPLADFSQASVANAEAQRRDSRRQSHVSFMDTRSIPDEESLMDSLRLFDQRSI
ncbi:hypothetical protein [Parasitella parasitica]|uniref:Uncharacterized protein n=1 Tax=Parasitella parasitica TaxID=35722 RepID=A0A0B7NUN3_9FUNG|nr:hypothetical protein [Parasitella parasitica]